MGIETLLSRLSGVRAGSAIGRWMARCPAHEDRSPSLAIRYEDDGRILLKCFAGCSAVDVVTAVGLAMTDLFPEPLTRTAMPKIPAPFSALDALKCLAQESAVVAIAASDIALGVPISEADHARIASAAGLINAALEGVHGIA